MPLDKSINLICLVFHCLRGLVAYFGRQQLGLVTWLCVMLMAMTSSLAQNSVTGMRIGAVTVDETPGLRLVVETRAFQQPDAVPVFHQLSQHQCACR